MKVEINQAPEVFRHGGNLDKARQMFGAVERWIDLSTGINPIAYPVPELSAEPWQRLPDRHAVAQLRTVAADYFGVANQAHLIEAPGTQALLQILPRVIAASHVAIISPTYNEHGRCWGRSAAKISEINSLAELPETADVCIIVNPNNPDGSFEPPERLLEVADLMRARDGLLIIDEAFCDVTPSLSVAAHAGHEGLLILRSFGKFFGLAGLRLGFAIGPVRLIDNLAQEIGPWAVSGPALEIGATAYGDQNWISETRKRLTIDAARLKQLLEAAGIKCPGGTDLFVLAQVENAERLWQHLAGYGLWTRIFDYDPSWVRFGHPGEEQDWARLQLALEEWAA